jgi:glutathione S-transferase
MTAPFRLYGAELSPYSVKVRSYLRFKGLEFQWLERSNARLEEFSRYAKLPLAPILVDAEENALQDSTPMIEALDAQFPEPSITPEDEALAFVAALLEDYADEWLNKAMFHYRWSYPEDQQSAAKRIVDMLFEGAEAPEGTEEAVRTRMIGRLHHVGSSPETTPLIEGSFARLVDLLESALKGRSYLFGGRPSLADFGLAAQLKQLLSDPTPGALLKAKAPGVVAWIERMEHPRVEGPFEALDALALVELLREEVAGAYLIWMAANAAAVADDAPGVSVDIGGALFVQKPQRYAAKAFAELRRKRALTQSEALAALLSAAGCDAFFTAPAAGGDDADESGESDSDDDGDDDQG